MKIIAGLLCVGAVGTAALAGMAVAQDVAPVSYRVTPVPDNRAMLVDFVAGEVRCDGGSAMPILVERPFPVWGNGAPGTQPITIVLKFRIDAEGRPLSIVREEAQFTVPTFYYPSEDVLPAFTAWRFAAGQARTGCRLRFEPKAVPVAQAPATLLRCYYVSPHERRPEEGALFARLHPGDTNCIDAGVPKVRLRAYPAFEKIPQPAGTWSYSMTEFDIDRSGKPVRVRLIDSGGNAVLDREAVAAVKRSRFAPQARQGCTYPYHRNSDTTMAAPASPTTASFQPADAQCPETDLKFQGPLRFPEGFERRRIEGWAVVGYDVAPWGDTGNVRVLAAEPVAAFGEQAMRVIQRGRQAAARTGRTGCVDIVRFVLAKGTGPVSEGE